MDKIKAILFDFDGVIVNTEPQYDAFFTGIAQKYNLGIDDFPSKIRGVTVPDMLKIFFSDYSEQDKKDIVTQTAEFESQMDFILVPGVEDFISYLQTNGYKIALVTSSPEAKMKIALKKLGMENTFGTMVTANQITKGKPDPMCYLLGAEKLGVGPEACIVFEDSIAGITAGKSAGMKVVGLSTTFSEQELKHHVNEIIPDFSAIDLLKTFLEE